MYPQKIFYRIGIPEKFTHKKLNRFIEKNEKNSFLNHMKSIFDYSNQNKIKGHIENNKFTFWRTNISFNGIFYPIFIGEVITMKSSNEKLLKVKIRFNPVTEILCLTFIIFFIYAWTIDIVLDKSHSIPLAYVIVGGIILLSLFLTFPLVLYLNLKDQILTEIKYRFDLKEVKIKKKKQQINSSSK